jgi:hypothetical protein
MTDFLPYFIGGGFIIVIIIVFNHKKQKSRLNQFAKDADDAPQMLLTQSVERKLKAIYEKLYDDGVKPNYAVEPSADSTTDRKVELRKELEQLETTYADKKITLRDYSNKLQKLQLRTNDI